jgi:hypothetical protein
MVLRRQAVALVVALVVVVGKLELRTLLVVVAGKLGREIAQRPEALLFELELKVYDCL